MSVGKAVKKPVTIKFVQYTGDNIKELEDFVGDNFGYPNYTISYHIITLEGSMEISHFDYVVKGNFGEFYPVKSAIFESNYDIIIDK